MTISHCSITTKNSIDIRIIMMNIYHECSEKIVQVNKMNHCCFIVAATKAKANIIYYLAC